MKIGKHHMRGLDVTVAVDHGAGNTTVQQAAQQYTDPGVTITGDKPPIVPKDWWPWILGAAALGALWWLVKDDVDEEGSGVPGPFEG